MSQENVEVVRQVIEANRSGDPDATLKLAVALSDPKVEFRSVLADVEGATYRGHDGIGRYFNDMTESWQEWHNEAGEVLEIAPDTVFTEVQFRAIGKDSGVTVEGHNAVVFVLSEGKVMRVHSYQSRDEALEAAGLSE